MQLLWCTCTVHMCACFTPTLHDHNYYTRNNNINADTHWKLCRVHIMCSNARPSKYMITSSVYQLALHIYTHMCVLSWTHVRVELEDNIKIKSRQLYIPLAFQLDW